MKRVLTVRTLGIALGVTLTVLILSVVATNVVAVHCFPDVPNANFAHEVICDIFNLGIVGGFPDGTYGPNANVTRAQMAVFTGNTVDLIPRAAFFNDETNTPVTANSFATANTIATLTITTARHCVLLMNGTADWGSLSAAGALRLAWIVNDAAVDAPDGGATAPHVFADAKHGTFSEDESLTAITGTVVPPGDHIVELRAWRGGSAPVLIGTVGSYALCVPLDEAGNVPTQSVP